MLTAVDVAIGLPSHEVVRDDDVALLHLPALAVITGARRSQLLARRWSDVDFDHAALGLSRALVEGPTGPVLRAQMIDRVVWPDPK